MKKVWAWVMQDTLKLIKKYPQASAIKTFVNIFNRPTFTINRILNNRPLDNFISDLYLPKSFFEACSIE